MINYGKPIKRVAIVGTGVIGASWAAQYLARGLDVIATDPAPNAEANLRNYVSTAWPALTKLGLVPGASKDRLQFTVNAADAVKNADFVQENGPERIEFKVRLYADLDAATPVDSIIASSSSALPMSQIQVNCKHPERCVIGHPFNPPHLIPLVEIVGGTKTSVEALDRAFAFYAQMGKKPIRLHKELRGHVANRLQGALYREIAYLVDQGVLSVADADIAVCWGPGLRWGLMGPSLLWHLAGGEGGIQHFMEHLAPGMAAGWKLLGDPDLTPALKQKIVAGVASEAGNRTIDQLEAERDTMLLELLSLRAADESKLALTEGLSRRTGG
jgi:3-hydroxyacyl-CoA dehydrogenase